MLTGDNIEESDMRTISIVTCAALLIVAACAVQPGTQVDTKMVPQAWEPARWEQMILAAKQARGRGNKAEPEQLCAPRVAVC